MVCSQDLETLATHGSDIYSHIGMGEHTFFLKDNRIHFSWIPSGFELLKIFLWRDVCSFSWPLLLLSFILFPLFPYCK